MFDLLLNTLRITVLFNFEDFQHNIHDINLLILLLTK